MRPFATAALLLGLVLARPPAEAAASSAVAAGRANAAFAESLARAAVTRDVNARTAQNAAVAVKESPVGKPSAVESSASKNFDFACQTLEAAARRNDLPVAYLTRLIWRESRFDPHAVSPAGARGVAQFMPGTAAWLGLANPFDVADAIDTSAEFLRDLRKQFGNLGLAAAAYNAGPKRVQDWLAGHGGLPRETEAYVSIITGHAVDDWRSAPAHQWDPALPEAIPCARLVKLLADNPEPISSRDTPDAAPVTDPARAPWGLQLIGDRSQASALAAYYQLQKTYKAVLGGLEPLVLRSRAGRGDYWYRIRVAAKTLFQAKRLCSDLRAAGGTCLVQRN
jgi:soluble lytic murein transglycosylase-like protein